ncbi:hypothetical protein I6H96_02625 [Brucella anthropi]|uniref:hypothetical protein n=1 Tax=Brucella anthropi TaxID=529 RepID=UPI0005A18DA3|nr:hypothetical protein [Brucella anthropi]NKC48136.1 hypothetical protein [Brucella anthropi ATCC 49188]QQC25776.1 hypothetical protein I6H96_02625 [Brucella anthropi]SUA65472.1 Uncharacterised protein [Brucella anthropi]
MDRLDGLAATLLSSTASFAALVSLLKRKGVLSDQDEREMYEQALLMLETSQADEPDCGPLYELARNVIEEQLKPNGD